MGRPIKHIITDLDHKSKTAICVLCGPTTFYSNGPGKWRCSYLEKLRTKRNQDEARALVKAFKEKPCTDCGVSYPYYVVDSDHVRGEKVGNISSMINRPLHILKAEIAKCDNVCSNCHRERTHQRGYPNALRNKKFTET